MRMGDQNDLEWG
jgi:hypothetical protein